MLFGLTIGLSWFDAVTVTSAFVAIVLIQVINARFATKSTTASPIDTTTTTATTATRAITIEPTTETTTSVTNGSTTNGSIKKQKTLQSEDSPASSPMSTISPLSFRKSITSLSSGSNTPSTPSTPITPHAPHMPHQSSVDTISDDYHEDEDTLSLENLFPCDQTEIYASKKISFIIDELIQTEANYVNNLRKGLRNYGHLEEQKDLPESLQGKERHDQLLGNIVEIMELHEQQILPMMLRNQRDLKMLFDEFATHFDKNNFYCYVIFTMNKKISMQLRQENREWFQQLQTEKNDKLGIDSFLVQPIQRLTRYPLLLQQFISEFYKSGIQCKPVLVSVCKLETRMRRLLELVNQSEEIPNIDELNELNLQQQGHFHRSTEFDAYHHRSRKKYRSKVFLFDRCLICTEFRKKRLTYRQHYAWETLELKLNTSKSITLQLKTNAGPKEEYELCSPEGISVTQWLRCSRKVVDRARIEAAQYGRFTLPMDLVLGVAAAVWLIWQYLY